MKNRILPYAAALTLMLAGLAAPAAAQVAQNITPIPNPSGSGTVVPVAINDSGVVAASISGPSGVWLWKPVGGWQNTGGLGQSPFPVGLNNSGQVVAWNVSDDGTHNEGLFYKPGTGWRVMEGFENNGVIPTGLNDNGVVVGGSWLGTFTWTEASGPTILPPLFYSSAVNNSGVVAGSFALAGNPGQEAAKWDATNGVTALGGESSRVFAINNGGMMAGYTYVGGIPHAVVWDAAGIPIAVLNAFGGYDDFFCECVWEQSIAYGINDSGQVVGISTKSDRTIVAFIWDKTNGMRELFPAASYPGSRAVDINNSGQIVASYQDPATGMTLGVVGTVAPPALPRNTPAGTNVPVSPLNTSTGNPAGMTLTFSNVTRAGVTTATPLANWAPPPASVVLLAPPYQVYDITTTALFSGPVKICFNYTGPQPVILHYANGGWSAAAPRTFPSPGVVCGLVTSLSPFALAVPRYEADPLLPRSGLVIDRRTLLLPVIFSTKLDGRFTCKLPPAGISVIRTSGPNPGPVDVSPERYQTAICQYFTVLKPRSLGEGTYEVSVQIDGLDVGSMSFRLK